MRKVWEQYLKIATLLYLLSVLVVLPLYYGKGYDQIGYEKVWLYQKICKVAFITVLPVFFIARIEEILLLIKARIFPKRSLQGTISPLDMWVLGYGISLLLSFLVSDYKASVLWGYEGWGLGAAPQFMMVLSYFLVSRFLFREEEGVWTGVHKGVRIAIGIATFLVYGIGILNRFMIDPLGIQKELYRSDMVYWEKGNFLSTIGNINWFSGYIVVTLFVAIGVFVFVPIKDRVTMWVMAGLCFVGSWVLVVQGSNTGHMTLVSMGLLLGYDTLVRTEKKHTLEPLRKWFLLGCLVFGCMCLSYVWIHLGGAFNYKDGLLRLLVNSPFPWCGLLFFFLGLLWITRLEKREKQRFPEIIELVRRFVFGGAILLVLLVLILMIVKTKAPDLLPFLPTEWFVLDVAWGNNRGVTFWAALCCFDSQDLLHKLFGLGPDGMVQYIYSSTNTWIRDTVAAVQGDLLLTNAHCEVLTVLVNQGLLGAICFVGMLIEAIKSGLSSDESYKNAIAIGLLAYGIHGIFSFSTVLNLSILFLLLGLVGNQKRNPQRIP